MKTLLCSTFVAVAVLGAPVPEVDPAVHSFYAAYQKLHFSGLPDAKQSQALSQFLSPELQTLMRSAKAEQTRCMRAFKDEKPPWIEGDLFSSNFEGVTRVDTVAVKAGGTAARQTVTVNFIYAEGKHTIKWSDDLVLVAAGNGRWVVDDVLYRGGQAFSSGFGASLRAALSQRGCEK